MSILTLFNNNPELMRGTTADVVDASKARADYESNAPTGVGVQDLPSMADIQTWENMLIGLVTPTGQIVTPERAKRNATVLAIMRGLSEDVGCLSQPLYKKGKDEDTIEEDHPVHQLLNVYPNDVHTPLEVREHMMFDLMTFGGFFNLKNEDPTLSPFDPGFGEVTGIWPLSAPYVVRRYRELVWTFTDPTTGMSGSFTPDLVWRGSILSSNGIDGMGITAMCKDAIGLLLAAEQQGARLFKQGVQTDLIVKTDKELGDEEKKQFRAALMERHSGSGNAFMPFLAEGGVTIEKLGLTAQESQYLEARGFQVAEIARVFRYPEVLLGTAGKNSKSATFASASQFFESYTKHTLGPWAIRFEQTSHRDLLSPKERKKYYTQSDFSHLLKADETARIENWNKKITGGWAQPYEARKAERMSYQEGLKYFTQPAGSTGTAGANPDGPQEPQPTDQSALARRVAFHLFTREQKAIIGNKQDADSFYTNFGGYIEGLTPADPISIRSYLEMRRNTPESVRFTTGVDAALSALTSLCTRTN